MIASYTDYLVQITRLIDGDDVTASEVSTETLNQVIGLAERKIYRDVRSRFNEKAFSAVTVTGNLATLPTDFEAVSIVHFGKLALLPCAEEWLREYIEEGHTGDCKHFAAAGNSLMFGPAVADGTALQGRYFCRLPDLTPATFAANALIAREPDLWIYAALVEAAPFFVNAQKQGQMFMEKYEQIKDRVNVDSSRIATNAGRVSRSASSGMVV